LNGESSEFFWVACKSSSNGLRREYDEPIPNLIAVACFLPGQAKNLSAPP
jgi:hypothetical protein